jgi:hypothetical protein
MSNSHVEAPEERCGPDGRVRGILRKVFSFTAYVAIIFAVSFGLAVFWEWMETATGSRLSLREGKEAAGWAITFAIGFSIGELWRQRPTRENDAPVTRFLLQNHLLRRGADWEGGQF